MRRGSDRGGEGGEKERKSFVAVPMATPCSLKHSQLSEKPPRPHPGPPAGRWSLKETPPVEEEGNRAVRRTPATTYRTNSLSTCSTPSNCNDIKASLWTRKLKYSSEWFSASQIKGSQYTGFPAWERTKNKGDFHGNTNIV